MNVLAEMLGSKIRAEILRLLFAGPQEALHVREIERRTGFNDRAIRVELQKLRSLDLLQARRDGNRLYYSARVDHPLYPALRDLALRTTGMLARLTQALDSPKVEAAFVFGSLARGEEKADSDLDLMVIGSAGLREISRLLSGVTEAVGRPINPVVYSRNEFRQRVDSGDHFLSRVLGEPRLWVKGTDHELRRLGLQRMA